MMVVFYGATWTEIGTKSSLEELVSSITGIRDINDWEEASIAQKLSCEVIDSLARVSARLGDAFTSCLARDRRNRS